MYAQVEKPKENNFSTKRQESRAVANYVAYKKSGVKQGFGFVDNRPKMVAAAKAHDIPFLLLCQRPIQRLIVGKDRIRPYGAKGKALWDKTKMRMIANGLSPHGAKKVFLREVKTDRTVQNENDFITSFIEAAKKEILRVENEKKALPKEKRTRGWTRLLKLARPAWTEIHKQATKSGQDIRHVVRNATIRNALKAEYDSQMKNGPNIALKSFQQLSKFLNIDSNANTAWELLDRIYKSAYLNFGNLFAGSGGINRVIGLTADDIYNAGAVWSASDDMTNSKEIGDLFDWVALKISEKSDQTELQILKLYNQQKISEDARDRFLSGLENFFDNICDYLIDVEQEYFDRAQEIEQQQGPYKFGGVWKSEVGRELMDIGANFGFDIPINAVGSEHMKTLLDAEIFLSTYKGGNLIGLSNILSKFLQLQNILSKK